MMVPHTRSNTAAALLSLFVVVGGATLFAVAFFGIGSKAIAVGLLAAMAPATAVLLWMRVRDWGRADEVVQAAHKTSWLHGAWLGAALFWVPSLFTPLPRLLADFIGAHFTRLDPAAMLYLCSGLALLAAMGLGATIFRFAWWRSKS